MYDTSEVENIFDTVIIYFFSNRFQSYPCLPTNNVFWSFHARKFFTFQNVHLRHVYKHIL